MLVGFNKEGNVTKLNKILVVFGLIIIASSLYLYSWQADPEKTLTESYSSVLPTKNLEVVGPDSSASVVINPKQQAVESTSKRLAVSKSLARSAEDVASELSEIKQLSVNIRSGLEKTGINESNFDEILSPILEGDISTAISFLEYLRQCRRLASVSSSKGEEYQESRWKWCSSSKQFLDQKMRQGSYSITEILSIYERVARAGGQLEQLSYLKLIPAALHSEEYVVQKEVEDWVRRRAYVRALGNEQAFSSPESHMLYLMFDYMRGSYGPENIPRAKAAAIYMESIGKAEGISDAFFVDYPIDEASVDKELAWIEGEIEKAAKASL